MRTMSLKTKEENNKGPFPITNIYTKSTKRRLRGRGLSQCRLLNLQNKLGFVNSEQQSDNIFSYTIL